MMFLEAFPLKHVVWILLKHSWCWGPTKCLDFAKCQILKEGLQTSVVEPLIQDQQFWILQNVESKHLKTDTCFPSEYKPGHSGSRMRHVFPSETFGRWENYFGMWENDFGRWENNFGWWENYIWKDNISINSIWALFVEWFEWKNVEWKFWARIWLNKFFTWIILVRI